MSNFCNDDIQRLVERANSMGLRDFMFQNPRSSCRSRRNTDSRDTCDNRRRCTNQNQRFTNQNRRSMNQNRRSTNQNRCRCSRKRITNQNRRCSFGNRRNHRNRSSKLEIIKDVGTAQTCVALECGTINHEKKIICSIIRL